jgi:hypothetical protein
MKPQIKKNYQTTFHRDGTISYWSVKHQKWMRHTAVYIIAFSSPDGFSHKEIERIKKIANSENPR